MNTQPSDKRLLEDPNAQLEKALIEEYLRGRGFSLESLADQPDELVKKLMTEATTHASLKLMEIEARAHFMAEVHGLVTHGLE